MKITRRFTEQGVDVFSSVEWTTRSSRIVNPDGSVVFEMNDAEVPRNWSQLATDIMVSKYFRKAGVPQTAPGSKEVLRDKDGRVITGPERSARQVIHRLAGCWRSWGEKHRYFDSAEDAQAFYDEIAWMLLVQMAAPNSPQWFNTGLNFAYGLSGPAQGHYYVDPATGEVKLAEDAYTHPQPHACVAGDTRVLTSEGWLSVREVVEDNRTDLRVFDGQCWAKILAVKHNGVRALHRMKLANGQYVDLTDDHQVLTAAKRGKDGGSYEWAPAEQTLGQKVLFTVNQDHENRVTPAAAGVKQNVAELVGFHVGDGYAGTYEGISHFGVCTATDDEFERVAELFDEVFGAHTVTAKPEVSDQYRIVRHDFNSTIPFVDEFELGRGSLNARVPERIFRAGVEAQRAFLRGLFQADGAVRIRKQGGRNSGDVCLSTSSPDLAHGVQTLLSGLGIYSRVKQRREKREDRADGYHVIIAYASERQKFAEQIGFADRVKNEKLRRLNETVAGKRKPTVSEETVVSFRRLRDDHVYDIQTSTGRFAANGVVVHNCFIQSIDDDLVNSGGIMDLWVREARLFKYGSGTGTNFSRLRAENEPLSGGGKSSGLMSWLKIGDRAAGAIKSGGTTRRAAKMVCLDLDHPDIEKFVNWKVREELKVAAMVEGAKRLPKQQRETLQRLGMKLDLDFNGEAYSTVSGQNSNNSVRISNKFFSRLDEDGWWELTWRTNGEVAKRIRARDLWEQIGYAAWRCADPGVQFDTTINQWHTCPASGRINASNPCSEYLFLDNTACNLASINLIKLFNADTREFDLEGFEHAIRLWTVVLEISVLMAAFPSKEIARLSHEYRTLGLGYANLGAMLMQAGIPYDSEMARGLAGALTAVMTGRSYATSAEMAAEHGPFPGYFKNREHMLRVIRNHRRAAYGVPRKMEASLDSEDDFHGLGWYEGLEIPPVPIAGELLESGGMETYGHLSNGDALLHAARRAWDDALREGEAHGYRNAQTTVIAPTGTIGLLMDCDTTGVEPDFALVKFKKLAGGGYFKIANQSLKPALKALGYGADEIQRIMTYVMGMLSLSVPMPDDNGRIPKNPTDTFADYLMARGANAEDLKKITDVLAGAMELRFVFNALTLGEATMQRLGVEEAEDVLVALGLSKRQVETLNEQICGTGTVEGAPGIKTEHLAVFDCANKCGRKGQRFIAPAGHIRMMAATQPFVSGAISKTINLPNEAGVEDIKDAYRLSWELGLKANALYRDGSKLSQVLSATADDQIEAEVEDEEGVDEAKKEVTAEVSAAAGRIASAATDQELAGAMKQVVKIEERIVERPLRRRLPNTRRSITHKFNVSGHEGYLTVGLYEDGNPGELFITMAKEGSTIGGLMDSLGTAISVALQYGVPVESLVHKFTHQRFEPAGMTDNKDIPFAKSLVDYIFRWMGMEFIAGYREANAPRRPAAKGEVKPEAKPEATVDVGELDRVESRATASSERKDSSQDDRAGVSQGGVAPAVYAGEVADPPWRDDEPGNGNGNNGGHGSARHSPSNGGRLRSDEVAAVTGGAGRLAIDDPQIAHAHQVRRSPLNSLQAKSITALAAVERANVTAAAMVTTLNAANSELMGDAPACDSCGSITVRNGTCYKCLNCGNSMGCS